MSLYTLLLASSGPALHTLLTHFVSFAAQTPIEEFTPTPAFPALQYLESVDEGGVAWRAGLRMGDFLIEVRHYISEKVKHSAIKEHHFWINAVNGLLQHLFQHGSLPASDVCVFRH